ncbi:unknown [Crocosphaera subtropica ATCC 51142]|uniref:Uncharacterized protein n=2 Tax=Crocosphaera TaxID=263510 RepID=B1WXQ2_CROS5|nr:unknown [Crocosphaera subtropica ATCC 51142]
MKIPIRRAVVMVESSSKKDWNCFEFSGYQIYSKDEQDYTIYQTGSHKDGDYLRIYVPKNPYQEKGKLKVITYLHGFALCMPQFYEQHLSQLATLGYYVFFPDYQKSDYPDFSDEPTSEKSDLSYWSLATGTFFTGMILRRDTNPTDIAEFKTKNNRQKIRLSLGLIILIIFLRIYGFIKKEYAQNLLSMVFTVLSSLFYAPKDWLAFAVNSTVVGWGKLQEYCRQNPSDNHSKLLFEKDIDFYVFGHSLGGLLALSWPYYLKQHPQQDLNLFTPKQIITADPAPTTNLGIPSIAFIILKVFGFPFATQPMTIEETGKSLEIPVGILHGIDDKIVKATEWIIPPLEDQKGRFFTIHSSQKKIYFSESNPEKNLKADHNQSVTNTEYYGDGFMDNFGGAKDGPDAYNYQYIWPALQAVVTDQVPVNQLANKKGFDLKDFGVVDEPNPPSNIKRIILGILGVLGLLGVGYLMINY